MHAFEKIFNVMVYIVRPTEVGLALYANQEGWWLQECNLDNNEMSSREDREVDYTKNPNNVFVYHEDMNHYDVLVPTDAGGKKKNTKKRGNGERKRAATPVAPDSNDGPPATGKRNQPTPNRRNQERKRKRPRAGTKEKEKTHKPTAQRGKCPTQTQTEEFLSYGRNFDSTKREATELLVIARKLKNTAEVRDGNRRAKAEQHHRPHDIREEEESIINRHRRQYKTPPQPLPLETNDSSNSMGRYKR